MTRPTACMPLVAIAFGLAACDARSPSGPAPDEPPAVVAKTPEAPTRYVGRWASEPANCAAGAWTFEPRRLATAGEVSCEFEQVSVTAAGYRVMAQCVAQAPPQPYTFSLTFEGPPDAQRMIVAGGPWSGPVSLARCGG